MPSVPIDINAATDNIIIPAQGEKTRIKILSVICIAAGSVNITLKDGDEQLTGPMPLIASSGFSPPVAVDEPLYWLSSNSPFVITLSGGVQVSGSVTYAVQYLS